MVWVPIYFFSVFFPALVSLSIAYVHASNNIHSMDEMSKAYNQFNNFFIENNVSLTSGRKICALIVLSLCH